MPDIFAEQMLQPDHQRIGVWLSVAPIGAAIKEKKFYDKENGHAVKSLIFIKQI